jgi:hypothetical protein
MPCFDDKNRQKSECVLQAEVGVVDEWLRCVSHLLPLDRFWVQERQQ